MEEAQCMKIKVFVLTCFQLIGNRKKREKTKKRNYHTYFLKKSNTILITKVILYSFKNLGFWQIK